MGQLLDSAVQFLSEGGGAFTHNEDEDWASLYYTGKTGSWLTWFQDRGSSLVAYAVCPVKAPVDRLAAVSEVISRANYGLGVGNFELSFEDGSVRYKSGIYAQDEQLSVAMVGHLFHITNLTMDDYFPAIMAVLYGDTLPELAIARVEDAIQVRRAAANADSSTTVEAPDDDDEDATEPIAINEELETLLATLSSGFAVPHTGENHSVVDDQAKEGHGDESAE